MQKYFCNKCLCNFFPFHTLWNVELLKLSYNSLRKGNKKIIGLTHPQYTDLDNFKSDYINFLFINIRSLNCNFDKIQQLIYNFRIIPSIIRVSETWLLQTKYFTHTLSGIISFIVNLSLNVVVLQCLSAISFHTKLLKTITLTSMAVRIYGLK